jgi:AAA family ATP:ADP antiporter
MEFTEIAWKASVKQAFPVKSDYMMFMGRYSLLVGIASFVMMIVGVNVIKVFGWEAGAMVTPAMMGALALPFFGCLIGRGGRDWGTSTGGGIGGESNDMMVASRRSLMVAVYVGLVQNVLSKGTKYSIFDPTKEMTYIPLDKESKSKGKAAIDVLGARLGKSGGALVQQVLVMATGSILRGAPVLAALFYIVIAAWIGNENTLRIGSDIIIFLSVIYPPCLILPSVRAVPDSEILTNFAL